MRFFIDDGQPAVRAAAVFAIDKSYELAGRKNAYTIVFRVIDEVTVNWSYDTPDERDSVFDMLMAGKKTRKLAKIIST